MGSPGKPGNCHFGNFRINKAGYRAVEESELGDGGGGYSHLEEVRLKRVKATIDFGIIFNLS